MLPAHTHRPIAHHPQDGLITRVHCCREASLPLPPQFPHVCKYRVPLGLLSLGELVSVSLLNTTSSSPLPTPSSVETPLALNLNPFQFQIFLSWPLVPSFSQIWVLALHSVSGPPPYTHPDSYPRLPKFLSPKIYSSAPGYFSAPPPDM